VGADYQLQPIQVLPGKGILADTLKELLIVVAVAEAAQDLQAVMPAAHILVILAEQSTEMVDRLVAQAATE
jgi:hypothetical protein